MALPQRLSLSSTPSISERSLPFPFTKSSYTTINSPRDLNAIPVPTPCSDVEKERQLEALKREKNGLEVATTEAQVIAAWYKFGSAKAGIATARLDFETSKLRVGISAQKYLQTKLESAAQADLTQFQYAKFQFDQTNLRNKFELEKGKAQALEAEVKEFSDLRDIARFAPGK